MTKPAKQFALLLGLLCPALAACGFLPAAEAAAPQLSLPGMTVNVAERYVDLEATVCLDEGLLELVACTKGTKEHESIVAVEALPMHIHTALLVLGATNGHPAMRRPREPPATGWIDIPPEGDPIEVSLMLPDTDGQPVEHRISEFVAPAGLDSDGAAGDGGDEAGFPDAFVFAGSHLRDNGDGPRTYLADESGSVISIATFGDELLCLEGMHGQANDALLWQVNPDSLPPVGTKVTLRLRVRKPIIAAPEDPPF
jgi:hypothetical protein